MEQDRAQENYHLRPMLCHCAQKKQKAVPMQEQLEQAAIIQPVFL